MHSTQGRIHLQSSCQCRKFIWSELCFPRTLPPPLQSSRETSHPNDLNTWRAVAPTIVKFLHLFKSSQAPRHITGRRSSQKRSKILALLLSRWNKHQMWRTVFSLSQQRYWKSLTQLCHSYWFPKGHDPYSVEEIFFYRSLKKQTYVLTVKWATGTMSKGKFGPELSSHIASWRCTNGSDGIAIRSFNFVIRWKWVISFTLRPLCSSLRSSRSPDRIPDRPACRPEVPNLCSAGPKGLRMHFPGAPRPLQENKIKKNWMKLKFWQYHVYWW